MGRKTVDMCVANFAKGHVDCGRQLADEEHQHLCTRVSEADSYSWNHTEGAQSRPVLY